MIPRLVPEISPCDAFSSSSRNWVFSEVDDKEEKEKEDFTDDNYLTV